LILLNYYITIILSVTITKSNAPINVKSLVETSYLYKRLSDI
jgi:hypothetical protein